MKRCLTVAVQSKLDSTLASRWGSFGGVDEVGRGAIAGPLAVGLVVTRARYLPPSGLTDSKLLSPKARVRLVGPIADWADAHAIGWANESEVSARGVTGALRLATMRALYLVERSLYLSGKGGLGGLLLDGSYNWMNADQPDLFTEEGGTEPRGSVSEVPPVVTQVKADRLSAAVAAASVIAKVARDDYMASIRDPGYGWASNKGYASSAHIAALRQMGPCSTHRLGWKLPGVS